MSASPNRTPRPPRAAIGIIARSRDPAAVLVSGSRRGAGARASGRIADEVVGSKGAAQSTAETPAETKRPRPRPARQDRIRPKPRPRQPRRTKPRQPWMTRLRPLPCAGLLFRNRTDQSTASRRRMSNSYVDEYSAARPWMARRRHGLSFTPAEVRKPAGCLNLCSNPITCLRFSPARWASWRSSSALFSILPRLAASLKVSQTTGSASNASRSGDHVEPDIRRPARGSSPGRPRQQAGRLPRHAVECSQSSARVQYSQSDSTAKRSRSRRRGQPAALLQRLEACRGVVTPGLLDALLARRSCQASDSSRKCRRRPIVSMTAVRPRTGKGEHRDS